MTRNGHTLNLIAALAFGALIILSGTAVTAGEKTTSFGLKAGFFSPGTVYPEFGGELSGNLGLSFGGFVDHMLSPKMSGGAHLDIHTVSVEDESETMFEVGFNLKAHLSQPNAAVAFRPGFSLGYGSMTGNEFLESTQYVMLKGFTEMLFKSSGSISFMGEFGLGYISGGNGDIGVEAGPTLTIRGGMLFN